MVNYGAGGASLGYLSLASLVHPADLCGTNGLPLTPNDSRILGRAAALPLQNSECSVCARDGKGCLEWGVKWRLDVPRDSGQKAAQKNPYSTCLSVCVRVVGQAGAQSLIPRPLRPSTENTATQTSNAPSKTRLAQMVATVRGKDGTYVDRVLGSGM
jgi:hypothetical protein